MRSGAVEIPAYRQLADPNSLLSEDGRRLCREVESRTGIPTFYYLLRYWGRSKDDDERFVLDVAEFGAPQSAQTANPSGNSISNANHADWFRIEGKSSTAAMLGSVSMPGLRPPDDRQQLSASEAESELVSRASGGTGPPLFLRVFLCDLRASAFRYSCTSVIRPQQATT